MNSAWSCPCATSSSPNSCAIARSLRPASGPDRRSASAASAAAAARRSAANSTSSLRARIAPTIGAADAHAAPGTARCSASTCDPQIRSPTKTGPRAGDPRRHDRVRVLIVSPIEQLEVTGRGRRGGERPLQRSARAGRARLGRDHEHGRALERHRLVPDQVARSGDGATSNAPPPASASRLAAPRRRPRSIAASTAQTLRRICCGTTWNVTGVVPSANPSATTGSGASRT